MTDIAQLLIAARRHHQAGDLGQAEREYRKILAAQPNHAAARHSLGVVLQQRGQHSAAIDELTRALQLGASPATVHNHLGLVHTAAGHARQAEQSFRASLGLNPRDAQVHFNLATLLRAQGNSVAAIESYRQAVRLRPDLAPAHYYLANLLLDQGHLDEAADHYRLALQADPRNLAAGNNLGCVLIRLDRLDEAAACFRRVLEVDPRHVEARYGLGSVLQTQGHDQEAIEHLRSVLQHKPDHADARCNLGCALTALGRLDEAVSEFRQLLAARPDLAEAHSGLGAALYWQGLNDEALASYDRAIELKPDFARARYSRSLIWLSQGDLARGWPEHEWRLECTRQSLPQFSQPLWDGSNLEGRTILLYAEQGLGDAIQFTRYVSLVEPLAARVLVGVQPVLVPLLRASGIKNLFSVGEKLPPFDVHAPLMSLPSIFRTSLDTIPAEVPYLRAEPARVQRWRPVVERLAGFRVGIIWQGNPTFQFDRFRSIPLVEYAPLADVPGVQLISLQKVSGTEQLAALGGRFDVARLTDDEDTSPDALLDTAAIMQNLDLVITSDTGPAHLAGALGVPVWLALSAVPDWRWFIDRDDCPWYPTMRLFRQARLGEWAELFHRIADELASLQN